MIDRAGQVEIGKTDNGRVVIASWPRLLTVEQAAAYLGLSPKTIRNHKCQLPGRRNWGGKPVFDRYALDKMIDRSRGTRSLWVDAEKSGS